MYVTLNTINSVKQTAFQNLPSYIQHIHYWVCSSNRLVRYPQTHRLSTRSVLLPTSMMITSLPRSVRTSSTQRDVFRNDCRSAIYKFVRMSYVRHSLTMDPPELHNRLRNIGRETLLQMENNTLALCYT